MTKIKGCFKHGFQDLIDCAGCILMKGGTECKNYVTRNNRKYFDENMDVVPVDEVEL